VPRAYRMADRIGLASLQRFTQIASLPVLGMHSELHFI
jgi:hypothetical protein